MKSSNNKKHDTTAMPKDVIWAFMHQHDLCVLSTVTPDGESESALVGFSENEHFELMIGLTISSRKFHNLKTNPHVSVVIGWDAGITVQYEGVARILSDGQELQAYQANHFAKLPGAYKYKDRREQCYIVISPRWLRYTDTNQSPRLIEEITVQ